MMFAGVVHAQNDIRYEQIEMPEPGAGQVQIKVKYTGICGSDVPRVNGTACHFFPMVLGHEFSGIVSKVGEGVTNLKVGDRIAGVPLVPCMECDDCLQGNFSLCKHYSFIGSRQFGSFAEYVVIPATNAVKFDDAVSFEQGALFEPSTVSLHALQCIDYKGGGRVAVLGCGTIGLFALQWARIFGASQIVAFNRSREKLKLAKKLGATDVISTLDEDYYEQAMKLTQGKGFDYIFDASGNETMMKESFRLAGNKAQICMIGTPKNEITFSVSEWENMNRKEFTVTGSWMSYSAPFPGKEWDLTAHYFQTGDLIYDEALIDRKIPLSNIDEAFELFKTPGMVKGKILIDSER
jgi:L-iditol 2-dehydrogenase